MLVIGIAGGSGSGKTTVVKAITEQLNAKRVVVIPQDSYYKDSSDLSDEEKIHIFQFMATFKSRHFYMVNGLGDMHLFEFFATQESSFLYILDCIWDRICSSHLDSWESIKRIFLF